MIITKHTKDCYPIRQDAMVKATENTNYFLQKIFDLKARPPYRHPINYLLERGNQPVKHYRD